MPRSDFKTYGAGSAIPHCVTASFFVVVTALAVVLSACGGAGTGNPAPATAEDGRPGAGSGTAASPHGADEITPPAPSTARGIPDPSGVVPGPDVSSLLATMSGEDLAGQLLMVSVEGTVGLSPRSARLLHELRPGAVILFGYNLGADPVDTAVLTQAIRTGVSGLPPFVAIDHEGGKVFRFGRRLTRLPAAAAMGVSGAAVSGPAMTAALKVAETAGAIAGTELALLGITMNLAPVAESLDGFNDAFLGDRAWSDDPRAAGTLAAAWAVACQSAGTLSVGKHFPGNAAGDPHRVLPRMTVPRVRLEGAYLAPFRALIDAGVGAIMMSHAVVEAMDPEMPASLSPGVLALLRNELGFTGIILTDDLSMAAVAASVSRVNASSGTVTTPSADRTPGQLAGMAAVAAIRAGVDMVMVTGHDEARAVSDALQSAVRDGSITETRLKDAVTRILRAKIRYGLMDAENPEYQVDRNVLGGQLDAAVHQNRQALADAIAEAADYR